MGSFCHLHTHMEMSLLDGFGSIKNYVARAKELGHEYLACTDHGNIDGLIQFQKECIKAEIIPIFGCELYIVPDMNIKVKGDIRYHITVLVKNDIGWKNLCYLLTEANLKGMYYKPRTDFASFLKYSEGLVILTGCLQSFLHHPEGKKLAKELKKINRDIYIEVQPHEYKQQKEYNKLVLSINETWDIPLVATNDCHYINREDSLGQEVLLAIQTRVKWDDPKRMRFEFKEMFLKSEQEMRKSFSNQGVLSREVYIRAIKNTVEIAKICSKFRIKKREVDLPVVNTGKVTEEVYLKNVCYMSYRQYFDESLNDNQEYFNRFNEEFNLIKKKKFVRYFLIVHELVEWCKEQKIMVGPGRGSVSGSLIAFLMGITSINPIKHNLLFSRFIDENRTDLPDIDLDFEDIKRPLIRKHLEDLYGINNVASISTFMKMKGRSAIRDVARVFDIPLKEVGEFTKLIFDEDKKTDSIKIAVESKEGNSFYKKYKKECDIAIQLEGQMRGCVDGDAIVLLENDSGKIKTKKIKNLFRDGFKGKKIRAYNFDKDILFFDEVKDVFYSGRKKTIELEVKVKYKKNKISLTSDHNVLTENGWIEAGKIKKGDFLATNGIPWNKGLKGRQVAWNKGLTKDDSKAIMMSSERMKKNNPAKLSHVKKMVAERSFKHGLYSKDFEKLLQIKKCEICGNEIKKLDRHHKNKNRKDNRRKNIDVCCKQCHFKADGQDFKINPKTTIAFSEVVSIKKSGMKDVYDITMKSKNVNFIANKIVVHNCGQHAAALVVSAEDLTKNSRCNLAVRSNQEVINWDKEDVDYVGLMKLDILGLNTLTVLNETKRLVKENYNKEINFEELELNDKKVFQMLSRGENVGVFQFNTWAMQKLSKEVGVDNFKIMSDVMALVRPGPSASGMTEDFIARKKGEKWQKKHKIYEDITKDTYGIIVYQEQVMEVINKVAGLSYSIADKIRKIIGKKRDVKEFDKYYQMFVDGCLEQKTLSKKEAKDFWNMLEKYANYGFNKAHSTAYSVIAYYCAWCKIKYPAEFICANLSYGSESKKEELVKEAKNLGLQVIPPKVGISDALKWVVKDKNIYIPFIEVKGLGEKTVNAICLPIQKKRKGFFNLESKPIYTEKVKRILTEIGAFDKESNRKLNLSEYFSFKI